MRVHARACAGMRGHARACVGMRTRLECLAKGFPLGLRALAKLILLVQRREVVEDAYLT